MVLYTGGVTVGVVVEQSRGVILWQETVALLVQESEAQDSQPKLTIVKGFSSSSSPLTPAAFLSWLSCNANDTTNKKLYKSKP